MSKRNRKRRRNRPRNNPSQRRSSEKIQKKQPKAEVVDHTRRRLILGGAAAAIASIVGYRILRDDKTVQPISPKIATPKPSVKPDIPEYEEWASKIELPVIEPYQTSPPLSPEEIEKNFLPSEIDKQKLIEFYKRYDLMKREILRAVSETKEPEKRRQLMFNFVSHLFRAYAEANQKICKSRTDIQSRSISEEYG